MEKIETYTAFDKTSLVARGSLSDVILKIKKTIGNSDHSPILIFSDATGKTFDFNFQGSEAQVLKRLEIFVANNKFDSAPSGPGRPKLGVISREVSLLPRHWEWLATQSAGASGTIRSLVEEAMKKPLKKKESLKRQQEKTYRVMTVLGGDLPGYEEAIRALYKRDEMSFAQYTQSWSKDIREYLREFTEEIFAE